MEKQTRGPYKRGIEKKHEILSVALDLFARQGFAATSMREIAKASSLTQAGLLHHFPTKDELLMTIIVERDARQGSSIWDPATWRQQFLKTARTNQDNRAETLLFSSLSAAAEDESHPAHNYMVTRYKKMVRGLSLAIAQEHSRESPVETDIKTAEMVVAIWDGLQLQWLLSGIDILDSLSKALDLIAPKP